MNTSLADTVRYISLGLIYALTFYLFTPATNFNCPKLLCSSQDLLTTNMATVEKIVSSASESFQRTHTNMDKMYTQYRRKAPSVSISNRIIRLNRFLLIHPTDSAQQDQLSLGPSNELQSNICPLLASKCSTMFSRGVCRSLKCLKMSSNGLNLNL